VADTVLPERGPLADSTVTRLVTLSTPHVPEDSDRVVRRVKSRIERDLPFAVALADFSDIPWPPAVLRITPTLSMTISTPRPPMIRATPSARLSAERSITSKPRPPGHCDASGVPYGS